MKLFNPTDLNFKNTYAGYEISVLEEVAQAAQTNNWGAVMQGCADLLNSEDALNHSIFFKAMLTFFIVSALANLGQDLTDPDLKASVTEHEDGLMAIWNRPAADGCPESWKFHLSAGIEAAQVARETIDQQLLAAQFN